MVSWGDTLRIDDRLVAFRRIHIKPLLDLLISDPRRHRIQPRVQGQTSKKFNINAIIAKPRQSSQRIILSTKEQQLVLNHKLGNLIA